VPHLLIAQEKAELFCLNPSGGLAWSTLTGPKHALRTCLWDAAAGKDFRRTTLAR
jgi:hypothetical protein